MRRMQSVDTYEILTTMWEHATCFHQGTAREGWLAGIEVLNKAIEVEALVKRRRRLAVNCQYRHESLTLIWDDVSS